jgi:predicted enzyme related to lactoylglutathione lyase
MVSAFDRIVIAVPDLANAMTQYGLLLGDTPVACTDASGRSVAWAGLPNTLIELVQAGPGAALISGIVFEDSGSGAIAAPVANTRGLDLGRCDGSASGEFRSRHPQSDSLRVDHLVLRTGDADACVQLFANQLGIRLALDKTVPQWGGRMLFLRAGKLTLEIIESERDPPEQDHFWGIAYQCRNLDQTARQLEQRGVELSAIRQGRKPGTRVATLKSHNLGIPTLLIEPAQVLQPPDKSGTVSTSVT